MATKTKPKATSKKANKPKLRGGTSDKPDEPLIGVGDFRDGEAVTHSEPHELNGDAATMPEGKAYVEGVNIDKPIPFEMPLDSSKCYDSPEALAEWDAETHTATQEKLQRRAVLAAQEESSKLAHKADKAALEEYQEAFMSWLTERGVQRGKPPQPKPAKLYEDPDTQVDRPALPATPTDDTWKAIPLTELAEKDGFPAYLIEKLANAARKDDRPCPPITTLGELTGFTEPEASGYTKKLSDLVGIGAGAVDKITDATIKFWERWAAEEAGRQASATTEPGEAVDAQTEEAE